MLNRQFLSSSDRREAYKDIFPEVRSYECFKYLHQGIVSPIKRKSLPEIAKVVGISSPQSLHHFISNSPWSVEELKAQRLALTLEALKEEKIIVVIDETGDRKKGKTTDYVARQYLGSIGKIDNGIVSVNAYGIYQNITFPLTSERETMPENSTSFVMTNIQEKRSKLKKILGNLYGLRTWVEYGFRQCQQELGWTDYRFTNFKEINKWWEIIFCAYLMISLNPQALRSLNSSNLPNFKDSQTNIDLTSHPQWNHQIGWKNVLNNLRLLLQPSLLFWLIFPWLEIFPNSYLLLGLHNLINSLNQFQPLLLSG